MNCKNCGDEMQVTFNKSTGEPFLICSNGYKFSHCSMPYGYKVDDFDVYMPNYESNLIDYLIEKMQEEDKDYYRRKDD